MLFLSDLPLLKLLFYIVSTVVKAFVITGHQFMYPLVERGRLWPQMAGRSVARHARYQPSLNFLTHFLTILSRMAFSPYMSHVTMNISRFHISCIQKTDNISYLTVDGALDHLEHFKCTEQYVNTICFFHIGICGLPVSEGRHCACAKSRP
jgi:hypothetical protein